MDSRFSVILPAAKEGEDKATTRNIAHTNQAVKVRFAAILNVWSVESLFIISILNVWSAKSLFIISILNGMIFQKQVSSGN